MLFNRHFVIICLSIFLIGAIFWWQKPSGTVSAMAGSEIGTNPYHLVKNYWQRLDYRQFDFASQCIANTAEVEHQQLQNILTSNLFLSIQKIQVSDTPDNHKLIVKITTGSAIDNKEETQYLIGIGKAENKILITSIQPIP